MRTAAILMLTIIAIATIALLRHEPNNGLPLVSAAIRESDEPASPAWLLIPRCPVTRRNIPTLKESDT